MAYYPIPGRSRNTPRCFMQQKLGCALDGKAISLELRSFKTFNSTKTLVNMEAI